MKNKSNITRNIIHVDLGSGSEGSALVRKLDEMAREDHSNRSTVARRLLFQIIERQQSPSPEPVKPQA